MIYFSLAETLAVSTKAGKALFQIVMEITPARVRRYGPTAIPVVSNPAWRIALSNFSQTARLRDRDLPSASLTLVPLSPAHPISEGGLSTRDRPRS